MSSSLTLTCISIIAAIWDQLYSYPSPYGECYLGLLSTNSLNAKIVIDNTHRRLDIFWSWLSRFIKLWPWLALTVSFKPGGQTVITVKFHENLVLFQAVKTGRWIGDRLPVLIDKDARPCSCNYTWQRFCDMLWLKCDVCKSQADISHHSPLYWALMVGTVLLYARFKETKHLSDPVPPNKGSKGALFKQSIK